MLVGLSGCAHPLNKNGVLSSRSTDCQLIKSQNGATSFKDASTSAFSDTQSADLQQIKNNINIGKETLHMTREWSTGSEIV